MKHGPYACVFLLCLAGCSDLRAAAVFPDGSADSTPPLAGGSGSAGVAGNTGGVGTADGAGGNGPLAGAAGSPAAGGSAGTTPPMDAGTADAPLAQTCPAAVRCSDNRKALERCESGSWSFGAACPLGCTAGACNVCDPNATQCASGTNAVEQCKPDGTGWGAATTCGAYACAAGKCKATCQAATDCVGVGCVATKCGAKVGQGGVCGSDEECSTGFCTAGVCCNARCDGSCQACGTGTCGAVPGDQPGVCTGARVCSSSGSCLLKDKQPCAGDAECASGACRVYHLDEDADGYGRLQADKFCGTTVPSPSYFLAGVDCCDRDPQVHPNLPNEKYFRVPGACGNYDYDCSGSINYATGSYSPSSMTDDEASVTRFEPGPFTRSQCTGTKTSPDSPCNPSRTFTEEPTADWCGRTGYPSSICVAGEAGACQVFTIPSGMGIRVYCR